jgi:RND family efflux transporter MFP subunit
MSKRLFQTKIQIQPFNYTHQLLFQRKKARFVVNLKSTQQFSAFLLSFLFVTSTAPAQQETKVGVDQVKTEVLKQTLPVIGRLIATRAGVIAARISGPVEEMKVRVGDRVEQGDVIAHLVDDSLDWRYQLIKAEVSEAKAAINKAKSLFNLRSQELRRLNGLKKSAAFSQARLEDKNLEVASARSAVAETQASLIRSQANQKLAEINLYNAKIRSPFPGVVSRRYIDVGAYLNVGSAVVDLIDDANLEIEASVPTKRISGLSPGTNISFQLETPNGQKHSTLTASVRAVVPDEDPLTRTRTVRFTINLSAQKRSLAANQSVVLAIPLAEEHDVLSVHKDAVINRKGKNIVFVIKNGVANIRTIRLGEPIGTRFVVLGGLQAGDIVVVRGNERLRPGQKVKH